MKRLRIILCLTILSILCGCESGPVHKHNWIPQTCTEPLVCTECGATKGEPWGHYWLDATCTRVKTCGRCGVTEGDMLPHNFSEPTIFERPTCLDCGFEEGDFLHTKLTPVASYKELYPASENCLVYGTGDGYGILLSDGSRLTEAYYAGAMTLLENDCFAMYTHSEEHGFAYSVFSSEGTLLWESGRKYPDYEMIGMAGGYLTLMNPEDNTWYYLDVNSNFEPKAYINASAYGKRTLSLVSNGYAAAPNDEGVGFPLLSIEKQAFVRGAFDEADIIAARGCPANDEGFILVTTWMHDENDVYYCKSSGVANINTGTYTTIDDWYDDKYLVRHIVKNNGSGINEYDYTDGIMLIQSDVKKGTPIFDIYSLDENEFITNYGLFDLSVGTGWAVAGIDTTEGEKFSQLNDQYMPEGVLWDALTGLNGHLGLGLKDGNAFLVNDKFGVISDGIKATGISHIFEGYFVVTDDAGATLLKLE